MQRRGATSASRNWKLQIESTGLYRRTVRKWGVIAVALVAAFLVLVVALTPSKDSIEYHLREYRNAVRRVQGHQRLTERISDFFNPKFTSEHLHKQSSARAGFGPARIFGG